MTYDDLQIVLMAAGAAAVIVYCWREDRRLDREAARARLERRLKDE